MSRARCSRSFDMAVFRPDPGVLSREVGDELVLVHMDRNTILSLNQTGARLWTLWTEGKSQSEAIDQLLTEYDVTRETLEAETDRLLGWLAAEHLGGFSESPKR